MLSSSVNQIQHTANGTTAAFAFPYSFFAATDLKVYVDQVEKGLTSDYTVAGVGGSFRNGGTVTLATMPAGGQVVTIERVLPLTQGTDYHSFSSFPAEVFENDLDRVFMALQQLDNRVKRAIYAPATDPVVDLMLPAKADRAGYMLGFDADGKPRAMLGYLGSPVSSWAATLLDDVDAPAGRATLDVYSKAEHDADLNDLAGAGRTTETVKANADAVALKANDADVVHKTGAESINGVKTFGSFPVTPSALPATDYEVANKKYVDENAGGGLGGKWVFTSGASQPWVCPADGVYKATVVGGGGGGGYRGTTGGNGGGGAGGAAVRWYTLTQDTECTYSVGGGGGYNANGGTSSFTDGTDAISGGGGVKSGLNATQGGNGGSASGGDLDIPGAGGGPGETTHSGNGGDSVLGSGGKAITGSHSNGNTGGTYGGGGGGPFFATSGTVYGGSGAAGVVIIERVG